MSTFAIIGTGPRGLSVLERLIIELNQAHPINKNIKVIVFDNVEPGAGRIWKTNQPDCLLMNTLARDVTMYSSNVNNESKIFDNRPSLAEWIDGSEDDSLITYKNTDFVPRRVYGLYLKYFFSEVVKQLSKFSEVEIIHDEVIDINKVGEEFIIETKNENKYFKSNSIVLALGHGKDNRNQNEYCSSVEYFRGDSAANMKLSTISENNTVFIKGLGLSFYDILSVLTIGRGGCYKTLNGKLYYFSSGREPKIIAGSRSGLPIPARGINQKEIGYNEQKNFFCKSVIEERLLFNNQKKLSFKDDIFPLIVAELEHVFYRSSIVQSDNVHRAKLFSKEYCDKRNPYLPISTYLEEMFNLQRFPKLDLHKLARPFESMSFNSQEDFRDELLNHIENDVNEAQRGNVLGPLKSALDIMRDIRDELRDIIESNIMSPESFISDFKGSFEPISSLLTAGPPVERLQQVIALIEAGILEVIGPDFEQHVDKNNHLYVNSPSVKRFKKRIDVFIDGVLPTPPLKHRCDLLVSNLLQKGLIREYAGFESYGVKGGLDIEMNTYRVINKFGKPQKGIFCIGIPTDKPNWFTQVGSGTVKKYSYFTKEADLLVKAMLQDVCITVDEVDHKIGMVS